MSMPTPDITDDGYDCGKGEALQVRFTDDDDPVTPEQVARRLDHLDTQMHLLTIAVNQVGAQTTWIANKIQYAFDMFAAMQTEMTKVGPLGILGMLTGKKNSGKEKTDA